MNEKLWKSIMVGAVAISAFALNVEPVNAEEKASEIPELNVYQKDNHMKLEWAIEMLDSNIITQTSFEDGEEMPSFVYNGVGGQSLSAAKAFSGSRSVQIKETTNKGGNYFSQPNVNLPGYYSDHSWMTFQRKYIENGTPLSVSFRVKTNAEHTYVLGIGTGGAVDKTLPLQQKYKLAKPMKFLEPTKIGDKVIKVSNVEQLAKLVNNGGKYYVASNYTETGAYSYTLMKSIDVANSTITLEKPMRQDFQIGDDVLGHEHYNPVKFTEAKVSADNEWKLINLNTQVANYENYNTLLRGFDFRLQSETSGTMYVDDFKFGYATEVELFRSNQPIYKGFLSGYEDTQAKDKEKPNNVSDVKITFENGKPKASWVEPKDNGTKYNYSIRAVDNKGIAQQTSPIQEVEVISGIKGYSVVLDKLPTTIPDNTVESTTPAFQHTQEVDGDFYMHIKAIDGAGNVSETKHILVSDVKPPTMTYKLSKSDLTNQDVIIELKAEDADSGIKGIKLPNGKWIYLDEAFYTVAQNGSYEFVAEDMLGNEFIETVKVDNIDKIKPTIEAVTIIEDYLTVLASDTGSTVTKTEVKVNDGSYLDYQDKKFKLIQNTEVLVRVTDQAGNVTEESFSLKNDAYYQNFLEQVAVIQAKVDAGKSKTELESFLGLLDTIKQEAVENLVLPSEQADVQKKAIVLAEKIQGILDSFEKVKVELEDLGDNPTQLELDKLKEIIKTLPPGPAKDALLKELDEKQKQVDLKNALLTKAGASVKLAEEFPTSFNIGRAESIVNRLPETPEKILLVEQLEVVKEFLKYKDAEVQLVQAERYEREPYLADAIKLVSNLKDGELKQGLLDRIQAILDKLNPPKEEIVYDDGEFDPHNPDRSIEEAIDTIQDKDAKKYLVRWHKANEHAANYLSRAMVANASKLYRELPTSYSERFSYGNLIAELTTRTEALVDAWEEVVKEKATEQLISKAYALVSLYEISKNERNYNNAFDAIVELPEGDAKTAIKIELSRLKGHLSGEDSAPGLNSKEKIVSSEKAVANYEKYKSSYYLKKAIELVGALENSTEKTIFERRLGLDSKEGLEKSLLIQEAEKAVENYEKYKSSYYLKKAVEAVGLLTDNEEKTLLQVRMNAVTI